MVRALVGDIGGTNARLRLIQFDQNGKTKIVAEKKYPSVDKVNKPPQHTTLTQILQLFLNEFPGEIPSVGILAIAGPVKNNTCKATNLPASWGVLDGKNLALTLNLPHVELINDFVAAGYGVLTVSRGSNAVHTLSNEAAKPVTGAPIIVIGAGTGLGECILFHNGSEYVAAPTEGGHVDFSPKNDLEAGLLRYILATRRDIPRVSVERLVCGSGLQIIYGYLRSITPYTRVPRNAELESAIKAHHDASVVLTNYALGVDKAGFPVKIDRIARRALRMWVSLYGAEAGNFALKTLPYGGVYIAGGIAVKLGKFFYNPQLFYANFLAKGRMRDTVLKHMPIYLVKDADNLGLSGSGHYASLLLQKAGKLPKPTPAALRSSL